MIVVTDDNLNMLFETMIERDARNMPSIVLELASICTSLKSHTDFVTTATWNPIQNLLATGSEDGTAIIWNVSNIHTPRVILAHQSTVNAIDWNVSKRLTVAHLVGMKRVHVRKRRQHYRRNNRIYFEP